MNKLLIAISQLVEYQQITIYIDEQENYVFKLSTSFGQDAKPFWVITPQTMELIKYHFEYGNIDEHLGKTIDHLFQQMDEAVINNEPETY